MVYDWDGKEDDCFRIYVEENGSLDDVMKYMKEKYNFEPRWAFPPLYGWYVHGRGLMKTWVVSELSRCSLRLVAIVF